PQRWSCHRFRSSPARRTPHPRRSARRLSQPIDLADHLEQRHGQVAVERAAIWISFAGDISRSEYRLTFRIANARGDPSSDAITFACQRSQIGTRGQVRQGANVNRGGQFVLALLPSNLALYRG